MAIKIPDAEDLGQPTFRGANTPAQIDTRSASAIGAGGKAIGDGIANLGGALGDLVGRIDATRKSQADSDFDLEMTQRYYSMQQQASLNAGSLGEGLTNFPTEIDSKVQELGKKYGLDEKQLRAKRETWAKQSNPWAYHSAQTRAQQGFVNQFEEAVNNSARFVQESPDAYEAQMAIIERKALDGEGKFWDRTTAEKSTRIAKRVMTDAFLRGLAEKQPDKVLDAISELRAKGVDVDGLDGGPYKGPGLGGGPQEAIKYRDLPPASASGINRGPRQGKVEGVVIHHTGGSGLEGAIEHGNASHTGANYYVDRDGSVVRAVPEGDRTTHIRESGTPYRNGSHPNLGNGNTVGIEVVAKNDADITPAQRKTLASLVGDIAKRNGIKADNIVGHGEIQGGPGGNREDNEGTAAAVAARQALGGGGPVQVAQAGTGNATDAPPVGTGGSVPDFSNEPMVKDTQLLEGLSPVARAIGILPRTNFQQVKRQTGATMEARLNKQISDGEAQIALSGEQTHITQEDLERARGIVTPAQFEKLQKRFSDLELKKFQRNAFATMLNSSAEERAQMVKESQPTPEQLAAPGAAEAAQRMSSVVAANKDINDMLAKDAAGTIYGSTEMGRSLYQEFNNSAAKTPGAEGTAYREALVERMLDEQTRQGVIGINQRILPEAQADQLVARLASVGDRKAASTYMDMLRNSYGKYTGQVMAELALKGAPTALMAMPLATTRGQDALMEALAEERRMRELKPDNRADMVSGKFLGKEGGLIKAEVYKQTAETLSLIGSENGPQAEGTRQAVEYIATKLLRDGKNTSADSAVADAIQMVYGENLKTIDNPLYSSWRGYGWDKVAVPAQALQQYGRDIGYGMAAVPQWLEEHKNELVNPFLAPNLQERVAGSTYERWRGSLGNVSFKITNEGDGVYMVDQNGQRVYRGVGGDNGYEPIKFTWGDLAKMSEQYRGQEKFSDKTGAKVSGPRGDHSGSTVPLGGQPKWRQQGGAMRFEGGDDEDVISVSQYNDGEYRGQAGVMSGKGLEEIGNIDPNYTPGPTVSSNIEDRRDSGEYIMRNPKTGATRVLTPDDDVLFKELSKNGWEQQDGSSITIGDTDDAARRSVRRQLARHGTQGSARRKNKHRGDGQPDIGGKDED